MTTKYCKLQKDFPWLSKLVGRDTNYEINVTRMGEDDKEWLTKPRFLLSPPVVLISLKGEILTDVRPSEAPVDAIGRVGAGRVQWVVTTKQHTIIIYKPPIEFSLAGLVTEAVPA